MRIAAFLLLSAAAPGAFANTGYLIGDPGAVCWKTTAGATKVALCPGATTISFSKKPPQPMTAMVKYATTFTLVVDLSATTLATSKGYQVPHANIHSCLRHLGACTPFVSNTPGLATHTAAAKANMTSMTTRRGKLQAVFETTMNLKANQYTTIAHGRFYDNAGTKWDIAWGYPMTVVAPSETLALDKSELVGLGIGVFLAWALLSTPVAYKVRQIGSLSGRKMLVDLIAESGLDAMELSAAVLIFSNLKDDIGTKQMAQLVLICVAVLNILCVDIFTLYKLNQSDVSIPEIDTNRKAWARLTFPLIAVLAGMEIDQYLESLTTTDFTTVIVLVADIGFRLQAMIHYLGSLQEPADIECDLPKTNGHTNDSTHKTTVESTAPLGKIATTTTPNLKLEAGGEQFSGCCASRFS